MSIKRNDLRGQERIKEIKELYKDKTIREIAELFSVSKGLIRNILKENGVALRPSYKRKGIEPWNKGKPYYAIRGDKNPNWSGGKTGLPQQIRHCIEMKNWKRKIRERDGDVCQVCKKRSKALEVDHHPIAFYVILAYHQIKTIDDARRCAKLWDVDNGRMLCVKCHKVTKM